MSIVEIMHDNTSTIFSIIQYYYIEPIIADRFTKTKRCRNTVIA